MILRDDGARAGDTTVEATDARTAVVDATFDRCETARSVIVGGELRRLRLVYLATFDPWGTDPPYGLAFLDPFSRAQRIDEDDRSTSTLALDYYASLGQTLAAYRTAVESIDYDAVVRAPWRRSLNAPYAAAARAARPGALNLGPCVRRLHAETRWDGDPRRALLASELAPYIHVTPPRDPPLGDVRHLLIADAVFEREAVVGAVWYALLAAGLSSTAEVTVAVPLVTVGTSGMSVPRR